MEEDFGLQCSSGNGQKAFSAKHCVCRFSTAVYRLEAAAGGFPNHPELAINLAIQVFLFYASKFWRNFEKFR
jgi:hypothetical protein